MSVLQKVAKKLQREVQNMLTPKEDAPQKKVPTAHTSPAKTEEETPSMDRVDLASMDSFPCSDPPGYYAVRS